MRVLFLANDSGGLYLFRRELIQKLIEKGYDVHFSVPNGPNVSELTQMGCIFEPYDFNRHGTNPFAEIRMIWDYKKIIKRVSPDMVFTYTIKPNVYGGMACMLLGVPYVSNITGLGTAIENGGILQKITLTLYKIGLKKAKKVFFQNNGNLQFMLEHNVIRGDYGLLPGSGVNLSAHSYRKYPQDSEEIVLLFVGRLMKDKGIEELLEAAKRMHLKGKKLRFVVVGSCEDDYSERLKELDAQKHLEFVGHQNNVDEWLEKAHALVHPSYHEGMSNVCLEAAACGRPVIASDIPGCRETFDEGISGFGFIPRDVDSLCNAIDKFLELPYEKKVEMGCAGREKMEREFDRNVIVERYIKVLEEQKEK